MYKFVVIQSSCGNQYNIKDAEKSANKMAEQGYRLASAYQSTTDGCIGVGAKHVLVMVFEKIQ